MPKVIKRKKNKKKQKTIDYSLPYEGAEGSSISKNAATKMWESKASSDEFVLGSEIPFQDTLGNWIVRTKLKSKA